MRYIIGQLNIYVLTFALHKFEHQVAQSVVSLTLKPHFPGRDPAAPRIFFLQIIFLHLSPLQLICISEVFDVSRVSSRGSFTYKILSNETVDPYLKYFTFSMLLITLKWTIFSCVIHKCILFYMQSNCLLWILF